MDWIQIRLQIHTAIHIWKEFQIDWHSGSVFLSFLCDRFLRGITEIVQVHLMPMRMSCLSSLPFTAIHYSIKFGIH